VTVAAYDLPNRPRNLLLASLSNADYAMLEPHLKYAEFSARQRVELPKRRIKTVVFIETGLASVIATGSRDRVRVEVAMIGHEGMTGLPVVLGIHYAPNDVIMQFAGSGQFIAAEDLQEAMSLSVTLSDCLHHYVHVYTVQAGQTALANARASLETRLSRWLLMAHDRMGNNALHVTHECLSAILGVRRAGVTIALHEFADQGLVSTARGAITITDRAGLEGAAGGFYGTAEAEFLRLFPDSRLQ
jgi:CRP-like cAMP-binding protein